MRLALCAPRLKQPTKTARDATDPRDCTRANRTAVRARKSLAEANIPPLRHAPPSPGPLNAHDVSTMRNLSAPSVESTGRRLCCLLRSNATSTTLPARSPHTGVSLRSMAEERERERKIPPTSKRGPPRAGCISTKRGSGPGADWPDAAIAPFVLGH